MRGRSEDKDAEIPINSLIDVVFLLIFFFIFTIQVKNDQIDKSVKLAEATHMKISEPNEHAFTLNVYKSGDEAKYSIGGSPYKLSDIRSRLIAAREEFGDQNIVVILRIGKDVPYKFVELLNREITEAGIGKVRHNTKFKK